MSDQKTVIEHLKKEIQKLKDVQRKAEEAERQKKLKEKRHTQYLEDLEWEFTRGGEAYNS